MSKRMLLLAVCAVLVPAVAWSDPFLYPPCVFWPSQWQLPTGGFITNEWVTQFPYQRNIRYTFDNGQNPLQPIYQGYDDNKLWTSDFVQPGPNWEWFPDDPPFGLAGAPRLGLIGIDNRQGSAPIEDNIVFHIDNWDDPNMWKHIWKEIIFYEGPVDFDGENETLLLPPGYNAFEPQVVMDLDLSDNYILFDVAFKVWPNPPWEEMLLEVIVPPGHFIIIDEIHFATECVPEPATVTLGVLGAGTLLGLRRRRRRK